ncbi:MAG: response regulator [Planctomycetota bacterium]|nr:response regulator transcription factor [Blastopirellula sp.]
MSRKRVLLADDHRIVAEGLKSILAEHYELVGIVENGRELLRAAKATEPDVIVADISMPQLNGLDAVAQLKAEGCSARIVFLTMHRDLMYAAKALALGASGFVLKHSASNELLGAITAALNGDTFVSPEIAPRGATGVVSGQAMAEQLETAELTARQREVLQLFAEGKSAKEVAAALGISPRTAENHKHRIMTQLSLTSTADLIQYALRHGLIAAE